MPVRLGSSADLPDSTWPVRPPAAQKIDILTPWELFPQTYAAGREIPRPQGPPSRFELWQGSGIPHAAGKSNARITALRIQYTRGRWPQEFAGCVRYVALGVTSLDR